MRVGKSSLDFNCLLCMDFKILLCMDFKILLCMDFKILLCLDFKSFFAWILASLFRLKKWLAKKVFLAWISSFAWVSKVPLLDPLWIPFGFPLDSLWIPFGFHLDPLWISYWGPNESWKTVFFLRTK